MNFFKKVMPAALGLFLIAGAVFAQGQQDKQSKTQISSEDVSEKELQELGMIAMKSRDIQREANQKMQQALNEYESIDAKRFQEIMMSKRNPQMADSIKISEKEKAAIKELQPKLNKINQSARKDVMDLIKKSDLTQKRLQAIQQALRSDKKLQKRFRDMMKKKQQEAASDNKK